jgi:chromosome partitioning protein
MNVISFLNSKGGVGKTTSCIAVGCCLAELGYKTLMIDLDHQGNLSDDFRRGEEDYTISDLFENPKFDINKIIYSALNEENSIDNLYIIPSDITLAIEARSAERFRHRLQILNDGINRITQKPDFILIDCRPAIDLSIENALLVSDFIVVPIDQDKRALKGINDLFEVIEEVKRDKNFEHLILNTKYDQRNKIMIREISKSLEDMKFNIAKNQIKSKQNKTNEVYKQATSAHIPSTIYDRSNKIKENYMSFTKELVDALA